VHWRLNQWLEAVALLGRREAGTEQPYGVSLARHRAASSEVTARALAQNPAAATTNTTTTPTMTMNVVGNHT